MNSALRVLECVDLGLEASGVDQAPQDLVVDVAESQGYAVEVFKAPVDGFDRAVGGADVEKCQMSVRRLCRLRPSWASSVSPA